MTLQIKITDQQPEKTTIQFNVIDTGIGKSQSDHHKIFDECYQANTAITRMYAGTGFGLAITKKTLTLQDISINNESKPIKGSRFFFDQSLKRPKKKQ